MLQSTVPNYRYLAKSPIRIIALFLSISCVIALTGCQMPSPYQSSSSPSSPSSPGSPGSSGSPGSPGSPDGMESVDQLDQSLDDSLGEFDAEVSGQSGNDRTSEIDILRPSGGSTLESDAEQPIYDDAGSIAEGDEALENRASEGPSESEAAAEGSSNSDSTISSSAGQPKQVTDEVPEDIGDGQGDNIVLRQIRDAAMQESDPTLKEKLWDEYRRIKSGKR